MVDLLDQNARIRYLSLEQASFGPSFAYLSSFSDVGERQYLGVWLARLRMLGSNLRTKDTSIVRTVWQGPSGVRSMEVPLYTKFEL